MKIEKGSRKFTLQVMAGSMYFLMFFGVIYYALSVPAGVDSQVLTVLGVIAALLGLSAGITQIANVFEHYAENRIKDLISPPEKKEP